jgi:hypothetical protein
MKFKDVRTIKTFIKEYGMDSGPSSYGSNKSAMAPSSSPTTKPNSSPMTKKSSQSPTTTGPVKKEQPKILAVRASDVPADAVVKNIKDEPMGKVVSRVGDKPKADALVVDTGKPGQKQYQVLDKDQKVFVDNPEYTEESKATKLLSKLKIKSKKLRSVKKILRNSKFNEQREIVFEINFNSQELAKSALNAPISCGFEAETTWPGLEAGGDEDDDFLDGMRWSDVEDLIYDQEGLRSVREVEQAFNEWLMESDYYWEAQSEVISELVNDRKDDMSYISDYAYQELGSDEVEDFKNETLEDLDDDEKSEYEDWGEDDWAKKLIEEKYEDSFEEWLADQIRENGEDHDDTWERVTSQVDIDDWMHREHGDWYSLLRDLDIYLYNPNSGGGVEAVAAELEPWAENNSMSSSVEAGEYHSGKSVDNDYWRVEEDSSIEADGAGAEIISPVYETPNQMLKEMNSLFDYFAKKDVETNSSTGLHVTMSWNGASTRENKLKMAVLLGDKYLLRLFDRENNTYTRSQLDNVAKGISDLMKNPSNLKTLSAVEEILSSKVSDNKFSSINFKDATNKAGNNLIEFRIAGGDDYHMKTTDIVKSVVRYAAIMQAGHDPDAFRKDYILALYRLIGKEAGTPDPEKIKSMNIAYGDAGKNPMLLALQTSSAKNNISAVTDYLVRGLELLDKAKQLQSQQAQGDLFAPTESVNEDGEDPARYYESAKENILMALAISALDIGTNKSRPPKAAGIAAIRKGIKELGLSTSTMWKSMLSNNMVLNQAHELRLDKYEFQTALAAGLSAMLKTNLGVQPEQPKAVVKYSAADVVYIKDSDYEAVQQGKAEPEMFMIATPAEQETNDAFKAKFGVERWDTTRLNRVDLQKITANTGIKFMQESVFDRFDKLSLEEQLRILERVDGEKLTEAWSKKKTNEDDMFGRHLLRRRAYKAALDALTGVLDRKGKSRRHSIVYYAARIAQSYEGVDARELAKMYKDTVEEAHGNSKIYDKCWDGYKKVPGKKRGEKGSCKKVKEGAVPDNRKVRILNKIMSKPLLASDIGAQMEAFFAIPDPLMVNEFRKQRSMGGDNVDLRPVVKGFIDGVLHPDVQKLVNVNESVMLEAKGIMGRIAGDMFIRGEEQLEFQNVNVYPMDTQQYETPEQRDAAIAEYEKQAGAKIEWTNTPNKAMLAFGIATLTDPLSNDKPTYWGRYFKARMVNMMGAWGNNQVPPGWKLQKAGAMKLDIGIDPQHLIKSENLHSSIDDIIRTVSTNSQGHEMHAELIGGLEQIKSGQNPVFEGDIQHLPALRDYFGEIMGPCALMAGMVKGQAEAANQDLLKGVGWDKCQVFWPQAMNYALVDSIFIGPNGEEVGVSSKGGKGAKASAKNLADAIKRSPPKLIKKYARSVDIIQIVENNSALDAPFKLAEFLQILQPKIEDEIKGYIKSGKTDYVGLSKDAKELFNYGTPRQEIPGFNTGLALLALLAKKVAAVVNQDPSFSEACIAFLNQSSIVQLYCKMGKSGQDARVTGWSAIYPPNFQGKIILDGSKNYYSSRIGGKFAFGPPSGYTG